MRTETFSAQALVKRLRNQKIATMPQLMDALGTRAERTVFRKLAELSYRTSYSHRGRYYTLEEVADFDVQGLWSFRDVWFSIRGTLVSTAEAWVQGAPAGYLVDELDHALHVATKDALRHLARDGRLSREKLRAQYLYCSGDPAVKRQQLLARRARAAAPREVGCPRRRSCPTSSRPPSCCSSVCCIRRGSSNAYVCSTRSSGASMRGSSR